MGLYNRCIVVSAHHSFLSFLQGLCYFSVSILSNLSISAASWFAETFCYRFSDILHDDASWIPECLHLSFIVSYLWYILGYFITNRSVSRISLLHWQIYLVPVPVIICLFICFLFNYKVFSHFSSVLVTTIRLRCRNFNNLGLSFFKSYV